MAVQAAYSAELSELHAELARLRGDLGDDAPAGRAGQRGGRPAGRVS